ncbi:MAG: hypothetical protein L3J78_03260, partial [Thermoplasmata archaeon]|nr:hypothetical protein [Thermoplasmata archaeon]
VASCVEISASVTITSGGLYIDQGPDGRDRAYVKILSGGTLTLVTSTVWSNYALAFYIANGGTLVTSGGSSLSLAAGGKSGLLREDGATSSVSIVDTTIDANVSLYGGAVSLVRDTFLGPSLWINSAQKTNLWDADLRLVSSLGFLTDDGNPATVDVDIRNTTFSPTQTPQLVFGGTQNVQLTDVSTYAPTGNWWAGMITGGASVSRYWWLRITAYDGSGTLLAGTVLNLTVQRIDPALLTPFNVPNPSAGDLYYASTSAWPVAAPRGFIFYRAFSESRTASTRTVNNSYVGTGTVFLDGTTYPPDANGQAIVNQNTFMNLTFRVNAQNQPDLALLASDYLGTKTVTQNVPFFVYVLIHNLGRSNAAGVTIAAYLGGNRSQQVGRLDGITVGASQVVNRTLNISAISLAGTRTIEIIVDPFNQIFEGSTAKESNNFANITLDVQPPRGFVVISTPNSGQSFAPGTMISVTGFVRDQGSNGIVGLPLTIAIQSGGTDVTTNTTQSQAGGFYASTIQVPNTLADGQYTIVVTPGSGIITPVSTPIVVAKPTSFLNSPVPILGLPYWLFFIILAAAAAIVIGVTLYWKVYGLGKMVECGECGAFIPEDSTSCPKCGVEFEKDMAKCSNCQAWIPVDVKQCPECGVEFATGQVEMADYQEKMRLQYDEVVTKFKEEANRQLGRSLSDREFQEWWRKQPTFLTFEDWLREEEDMRKMGSKPCPSCGTLNSVTATVCHKCGSLMREAPRPPGGGGTVA